MCIGQQQLRREKAVQTCTIQLGKHLAHLASSISSALQAMHGMHSHQLNQHSSTETQIRDSVVDFLICNHSRLINVKGSNVAISLVEFDLAFGRSRARTVLDTAIVETTKQLINSGHLGGKLIRRRVLSCVIANLDMMRPCVKGCTKAGWLNGHVVACRGGRFAFPLALVGAVLLTKLLPVLGAPAAAASIWRAAGTRLNQRCEEQEQKQEEGVVRHGMTVRGIVR